MSEVLTVFLYVAVVVIALLLIGLVLIQPSKNGGTGAAFGSVGESVFGAQAGSHLTKATVIMTSLFFLLVLLLATLIGRGNEESKRDAGVEKALTAVEKVDASAAVKTEAAAAKAEDAASKAKETVTAKAEDAASKAKETVTAKAEDAASKAKSALPAAPAAPAAPQK